MFRLAGHLKMTVKELESRMDSKELTEWLAFDRYYEPIGNDWLKTGYIVASVLAPHAKKAPSPNDFVPTAGPPPMHSSQIGSELEKMIKDLNGE